MSDKKDQIKDSLNRWESVEVPQKVKKTTFGNVDFSKYTEQMRSVNGLSVSESAQLMFGKLYDGTKAQHYKARNSVCRPAWRTNDKKTELSVGMSNNGDQKYYIIGKSEYPRWVEKMLASGHSVKIDSDNQYTPAEIGQE